MHLLRETPVIFFSTLDATESKQRPFELVERTMFQSTSGRSICTGIDAFENCISSNRTEGFEESLSHCIEARKTVWGNIRQKKKGMNTASPDGLNEFILNTPSRIAFGYNKEKT